MKYADAFLKSSSKILLGTTYFGDVISENEAFDIMDKYTELGGNHIDCARMYAGGNAEKVVGEWIRQRNPENVFVSTKGGFPDAPGKSRLSEKDIRFDLETSLSALKIDCVDFYWLHRDDETIPVSEIIDMMNKFVTEGKIKAFGASNWSVDRIDRANGYAATTGQRGFEASQIRFSPAVIAPGGDNDKTLADMDAQAFAYYKEKNMPVAAFASQAKGFFSKMANGGEKELSAKSRDRYYCRENVERFETIKRLAEKYDCPVAAIVCGAMCSISSPEIFPIIGGSNVMQIAQSMGGADITLTKEELEKIFGEKL